MGEHRGRARPGGSHSREASPERLPRRERELRRCRDSLHSTRYPMLFRHGRGKCLRTIGRRAGRLPGSARSSYNRAPPHHAAPQREEGQKESETEDPESQQPVDRGQVQRGTSGVIPMDAVHRHRPGRPRRSPAVRASSPPRSSACPSYRWPRHSGFPRWQGAAHPRPSNRSRSG